MALLTVSLGPLGFWSCGRPLRDGTGWHCSSSTSWRAAYTAVYSAPTAGLVGLTRALAAEFLSADEVAGVVVYLASDDARAVDGQSLVVDN
jgi:NAD(P)-dependent dehydrogenase (short-subunit alcohol dehydrogenase family)